MGKRRENRVLVSLPVRVSGNDSNGNPFVQTAQTLDVSRTGARLTGIRCLRGAGEIITIECSGSAARYLVAWIGLLGTAEDGHFGVRALQPEKRIFRVVLGDPKPDNYQPPAPQISEEVPALPVSFATERWDKKERRSTRRFPCNGTGQIQQQGVAFPTWAKVCDLSAGGCYLELIFTPQRLSKLRLTITINEHTFRANGTVVTSHPGIGVGVQFTGVDPGSEKTLQEILRQLSERSRKSSRSVTAPS